MLEEGLTPSKVADRLGVSVRSMRRWREAREEGGDGALSAKPVPGRPKKLGETECARLWSILLDGALAYYESVEKKLNEVEQRRASSGAAGRAFPPTKTRCHLERINALKLLKPMLRVGSPDETSAGAEQAAAEGAATHGRCGSAR